MDIQTSPAKREWGHSLQPQACHPPSQLPHRTGAPSPSPCPKARGGAHWNVRCHIRSHLSYKSKLSTNTPLCFKPAPVMQPYDIIIRYLWVETEVGVRSLRWALEGEEGRGEEGREGRGGEGRGGEGRGGEGRGGEGRGGEGGEGRGGEGRGGEGRGGEGRGGEGRGGEGRGGEGRGGEGRGGEGEEGRGGCSLAWPGLPVFVCHFQPAPQLVQV